MRIFRTKAILLQLLSSFTVTQYGFSQSFTDSNYIQPYEQKRTVTAFVARRSLELKYLDRNIKPNSPLNLGIGYYQKNTIINFEVSFLGVKLASNEKYGKTSVIDLQAHNYGKHLVLDVYYQRYKGFYEADEGQAPKAIFPNLTVQRIGAEVTYLFNSSKFSSKAAFQQKEKQLRSAGSVVLGGGLYHTQLSDTRELTQLPDNKVANVQLGLGAGYAYTWVINPYWLLSGIATTGIGACNAWSEFKSARLKVFPRAYARGAIGYNRDNWGMYFSMIIQNDKVYPANNEPLQLTGLNFQLAYVRHFNKLFGSK